MGPQSRCSTTNADASAIGPLQKWDRRCSNDAGEALLAAKLIFERAYGPALVEDVDDKPWKDLLEGLD